MNRAYKKMLLGMGLDCKDGHVRVTKGKNFALLGGSEETHSQMQEKAIKLNESDVELGSQAWQSFVAGEKALQSLSAGNFDWSRLAFMRDALMRFAEDCPEEGGLARSEEQLLEIVRNGKSGFADIFRSFGSYEQHMFLGDAQCRHLLDGLTGKGLLEKERGNAGIRYFPPRRGER